MTKGNKVKVGAHDELASIIDKIVTSDARLVFLVISDDALIAQNILNLQLIKRESENVDKEVVVVSTDPRIQNLAVKAGLKVSHQEEEGAVREPQGEKRYSRAMADILPPSHGETRQDEHTTDLRNTRSSVAEESPVAVEDEEGDEVSSGGIFERPKEAAKRAAEKDTDEEEELPVKTYDPDGEEELPKKKKRNRLKKRKEEKEKRRSVFSAGTSAFGERKRRVSPPAFLKKPLFLAGIVGSLAAAFGLWYLAVNVLPKATIVINPHTVEDEMSFAVVADSNISSADYTKNIIPAQILEERKEEVFTYQATGEAQLEEFATGVVEIYNEYSSSPQTLVANTRLMSSEGKLFRTTETVVVPGASIDGGRIIASSVEVPVRADEAGQDFNIDPTTFSIPGFQGDPRYLAFYGKSEESMSGGYRGVATVPTEEDIEGARARIEDELLPALEESLRSKVPEGLYMLEESINTYVESLNIDAEVGEPKEEFSVRFVGVSQVFLIKDEDVSNSIAHYFINSTEYSKDFELSDERDVEYTVREAAYEDGYTEFNLNVKQRFNRAVDPSAILNNVVGKDEVEVRRILSANEALQRAQVRFWPFWVKGVPNDTEKVEIRVEYNGSE